jgi:hypothetical protein
MPPIGEAIRGGGRRRGRKTSPEGFVRPGSRGRPDTVAFLNKDRFAVFELSTSASEVALGKGLSRDSHDFPMRFATTFPTGLQRSLRDTLAREMFDEYALKSDSSRMDTSNGILDARGRGKYAD